MSDHVGWTHAELKQALGTSAPLSHYICKPFQNTTKCRPYFFPTLQVIPRKSRGRILAQNKPHSPDLTQRRRLHSFLRMHLGVPFRPPRSKSPGTPLWSPPPLSARSNSALHMHTSHHTGPNGAPSQIAYCFGAHYANASALNLHRCGRRPGLPSYFVGWR